MIAVRGKQDHGPYKAMARIVIVRSDTEAYVRIWNGVSEALANDALRGDKTADLTRL